MALRSGRLTPALLGLLLATSAIAQTTGPSTAPPRPPSRGGVGVSIDPSAIIARTATDRGGSTDWRKLRGMTDALGEGPVARFDGSVVYRPALDGGPGVGVRIDVLDNGRRRAIISSAVEGQKAVELTAGEKTPCPCPEGVELERLKAEIARLQAENDALRAAAAPPPIAAPVSKPEVVPTPPSAPSPSSSATSGAGAVSFALDNTNADGREIDHANWDVMRLVVSGNRVQVVNGAGAWLADHPEVPPGHAQWVRDNIGVVPHGGFDFGDLGGESIQQRLERICDPPPSLEALKKAGSIAHVFSVSHREGKQHVKSTIGGETVSESTSETREEALDVELTAECEWSYDRRTGEVRKSVRMSLAVAYLNADGRRHEILYRTRDPQTGWVMAGGTGR